MALISSAHLDRARDLHHLLAVVHADALRLERCDALGIDMVDREPPVAAAVRAHQIGDLRGPARGVLGDAIAALEEVPAAPRPHLVDQVELRREVLAAVEVEHDHRPVGRDEGVAHRVVQAPDLHVGAVGGVADVDRIGDHDAGVVARGQLLRARAPRRYERIAATSGSSSPSACHSPTASAPGPRSPNEPSPRRRAAACTILDW